MNPTVLSDLALFDVAAGFFGQMAFNTTPELTYTFARNLATLARNAGLSASLAATQGEVPSAENSNQQNESENWDGVCLH